MRTRRHLHSIAPNEPIGRLLPRSEFYARPWRIHEIAPDFRVVDVWQLPTPGREDDLAALAELFATGSGDDGVSGIVRLVWSVRWTLGRVLGWDDPRHGVGIRVPSLNARLPEDLKDCPIGPDFTDLPFTPIYLLPNEFAAELANKTCHGVLHLGWVKTEFGCWTAQMTVLVQPNGTLGRAYVAGIQPFRHAFVYPSLLHKIERDWRGFRRPQEAAPTTSA